MKKKSKSLAQIEEDNKIKLIEIKKENIIRLFNPKLNLLLVISLYIDYNCIIKETLYDKLKIEIAEIIDKKNFQIGEIQRGSVIIKILLIHDLAKNGIKASKSTNF